MSIRSPPKSCSGPLASSSGRISGHSRDETEKHHLSVTTESQGENDANLNFAADTYAWWFTAVWFQTKWGWPYDTESTDRSGWTDANGVVNGFDDGTRGEGGVAGDPDDLMWLLDHKEGGIGGTTGG